MLGALFSACGAAAVDASTLVVTGGTLIDGTGRAAIPDATVVIANGKIVGAGAAGTVSIPTAAERMDVRGKWIVPGLIDAHVHHQDWMDSLFVSHGVTTVRDVGNDVDEILKQRESSATVGAKRPRIYACGALLDGPIPRWGSRVSRAIATVDEARAVARELILRKVDCLKVYEQLTPPQVQAVVEEATAHGVMVTAHLRDTSAADAVALGVRGLEHASGIDYRSASSDALTDLAGLFASKGIFVVPTLVVIDRVLARLQSPGLRNDPLLGLLPLRRRELWEVPFVTGRWTQANVAPTVALLRRKMELIQQLTRVSGRVVAGSDTPNPYIVPGASLHRELELLVEAGLTPLQAIGAATKTAAELLGQEASLGTLIQGKKADFVVVGGNPLEDISNLRQVEFVLRDGGIVWKR